MRGALASTQEPAGGLCVRPIGLREANEFVARATHGRHSPVRAHKFALAVQDSEGFVRGVAITGQPKAPLFATGWHLEVLRLATDGAPDICSVLFAAVARAGTAVGYRRQDILTHTFAPGHAASLRAAGWVPAVSAGASRGFRWHAAQPATSALLGSAASER